MNRRFPLAGLLRVRAMAEERAAAELATARRDERAAAARARSTEDRLGASGLPTVAEERAFQAAVASRVALASMLVEQRATAVAAQEETERRTEVWSDARRHVRAIERLEERHDDMVRVEEARAEQLVLDEVAGRRAAGQGRADA
ncbi:flagellar export protein FliJ [Cellulomonas sp.]|uniref:flagellar export protein FliJ n=1 Tax=Cellulomonas sp. TaxID=40001 RepID=UPI001B038D4B|nr:flagellar export protein FliJ [Cellulomonas sp.]MBO9553083.1 flagellar FliJ family protein [Cellulomonas sp.]